MTLISSVPFGSLRYSMGVSSLLLLELLRHIYQQIPDVEVLGAGFLTLAALDTVAGLAALLGVSLVVIIVGVPVPAP